MAFNFFIIYKYVSFWLFNQVPVVLKKDMQVIGLKKPPRECSVLDAGGKTPDNFYRENHVIR